MFHEKQKIIPSILSPDGVTNVGYEMVENSKYTNNNCNTNIMPSYHSCTLTLNNARKHKQIYSFTPKHFCPSSSEADCDFYHKSFDIRFKRWHSSNLYWPRKLYERMDASDRMEAACSWSDNSPLNLSLCFFSVGWLS